jgi:hypothetical protein
MRSPALENNSVLSCDKHKPSTLPLCPSMRATRWQVSRLNAYDMLVQLSHNSRKKHAKISPPSVPANICCSETVSAKIDLSCFIRWNSVGPGLWAPCEPFCSPTVAMVLPFCPSKSDAIHELSVKCQYSNHEEMCQLQCG